MVYRMILFYVLLILSILTYPLPDARVFGLPVAFFLSLYSALLLLWSCYRKKQKPNWRQAYPLVALLAGFLISSAASHSWNLAFLTRLLTFYTIYFVLSNGRILLDWSGKAVVAEQFARVLLNLVIASGIVFLVYGYYGYITGHIGVEPQFDWWPIAKYWGLHYLPSTRNADIHYMIFPLIAVLSFLADHKNSYLEGYWQNIHIVQPVLAKLQEGIVPPEKVTVSEWYNRLSTNNAIALHIRRGDYLSSPDARRHYGNICTESYYTAAVKIMRKLVPYAHFYIFTNDYKYCTQKYGTDADITVIPPCTDQSAYHDLLLMAQCPHHILANSSFSWWGTMLSTQPGYTIMPSVWDNCVTHNHLIIPNAVLLDNNGMTVEY